MGRPTKKDKRDRQLNLRLTAIEMEWVRGRARVCGMKPVDFGRAQLLAERPKRAVRRTPTAHLDPLFLAQISRVGNNLNQLTHCFHKGAMPAPSELGSLLQAIREIIRKGCANGP